jgi:hypothetical protein
MRTIMGLLAFSLIGFLPCKAQNPPKARDYYKELYAAGGLDRTADGYVCFFDDQKIDNFFIFSEGKHFREYMMANGTWDKLPKEVQAALKNDYLKFRGYTKGVPLNSGDLYTKDEDSWVSDEHVMDKDKGVNFKMRFTINWQTLRFKRSVEVLNSDSSYRGELPLFGRCEKIPSTITQHGPEENR